MPSEAPEFSQLMVLPGETVDLAARDPRATPGVKSEADADQWQDDNVKRIAELQTTLWADNRFALLVVLQGMDTSGKDGVIRHLLTGVNPMGCRVHSFGVPSKDELDHDYLWRVHAALPPLGTIGVFNRSHYEDVLVTRVHGLIDDRTAKQRFTQINRFEEHLSQNRYVVLKFMLHISKDEQGKRLRDRLDDPTKQWKMNLGDLKERGHWAAYMRVYQDALTHCSTLHAPWYVIPADRKWYRDYAISRIVVGALESLKLVYPKPNFDPKTVRVD